ncbi:NAD(P)-binding protein [Clathrospora elynae]|uniref:NAD(P)-binding protein n=1 Tax=Clathrospora elynae TaxID=706981 RepID=A0A6A5S4L5_9PLEO|nr:NAD(P)-binding protein [Clathrospora elynae]
MPFHPDTLPSLAGKVSIVTGATSGIGFHTVARLAEHNAHVYLRARTAEKGAATISLIQSLYAHAKLSVLLMDHVQLSSVVDAATKFLSLEARLDGLVNNVGIMATPFATNYLAHWVLCSHLVPLMLSTARQAKEAGEPAGRVRIVNLSSAGHYSAPKRDASGMTRYGQSKLANILHMKTLHRLYGPASSSSSTTPFTSQNGEIWLSAVHPGLVLSNLGAKAKLPGLIKALIAPIRWARGVMDADRGCWTSLFCVAAPEMRREDAGGYFQRIADAKGWQSAMAKDEGIAERLEGRTGEEMASGGWVRL